MQCRGEKHVIAWGWGVVGEAAPDLARCQCGFFTMEEARGIMKKLAAISSPSDALAAADALADAFKSIQWMAERYAEGGGSYSQEMEDYEQAVQALAAFRGARGAAKGDGDARD